MSHFIEYFGIIVAEMKSAVVYMILVATIAWAALLRAEKNVDTKNAIDDMAWALKGIDTALPMDRRISTKLYGADNTPFFLARYLLAPRFVSYPDNEKYDTVLSFCGPSVTNSELYSIMGYSQVLWNNKDDRYFYILTGKK